MKEGLREQESAWDEYLIKYGTFQGKKEALTRKYRNLMDSESDAAQKMQIVRKQNSFPICPMFCYV